MSNKNIIYNVFRVFSLGATLVFLGILSHQSFFPAAPSSAETMSTATAELQLEIEPTIEMALDKTVLSLAADGETEVLPTAEGITATGDINVYVSSNGVYGYRLGMYAQDSQEMKHINSEITSSILPVADQNTGLTANTWGYLHDGNWVAVSGDSGNASQIVSDGNPTAVCDDLATNYVTCAENGSAEKETVTFGAKVTDSLPSGRQTSNVVFTAIVKEPPVAGN